MGREGRRRGGGGGRGGNERGGEERRGEERRGEERWTGCHFLNGGLVTPLSLTNDDWRVTSKQRTSGLLVETKNSLCVYYCTVGVLSLQLYDRWHVGAACCCSPCSCSQIDFDDFTYRLRHGRDRICCIRLNSVYSVHKSTLIAFRHEAASS